MLHIPSAVFYGVMSTMMVFGNKYALTNLNFNRPIFMILMEMILNVSFMWLVNDSFSKEWRIDTSTVFHFLRQPSDYKYHFLVVIFYTLHSVLSLKALSGLNIPMYITFKRCTPMVNLLISIFVFKNMRLDTQHNKKLALSVVLITTGVIIAGLGDLDPDFKSYVYCALSVVFQAAYLSSIQKCGEEDAKSNRLAGGTSSLQTLYECSIFSTPLLTLFFLLTGEYSNIWKSLEVNSLLTIMAVIFCGSLLCFSQFWCTLNNNAVTTSVVGVLKSIVQTVAGMLLFESVTNFSSITLIGISINLASGCWYTYLKYMEKYGGEGIATTTTRPLLVSTAP